MASVVIVGTDLMFTSKVTGTARALGIEAVAAATAEALTVQLDEGAVRLVTVDMALPQAVAALQAAAAHPTWPTTIAFYSHVQTALAEAAKAAGAGMVMPRSKFSAELPEILRQYGTGGGGAGE
jgi:DNA-binding NarL/FixJ family response regulator